MNPSPISAISSGWARWSGRVCSAVLVGMAMPALAFELITKQEAARPNDPFKAKPATVRAGPIPEPDIKIYGNTVTTSPFNLVIELRPGAKSARINLDSLEMSYRKRPPVDLKPRIARFVDSSKHIVVIRIEGAEAPPGKHQILFKMEDSYEQPTSKAVDLEILADK